jgi:dihydroorotate dehydrogenase
MPSKTILSTIMNASGCYCRTKVQLDSLVAAGMKTIITKTCSLLPNKGNAQPVFLEVGTDASINCLGMPNQGYSYYREFYLEYKLRGITYIISMDASNCNELLEMLQDYDTYLSNLKRELRISSECLEYVEINLSCPSTSCPRIIAFDTLAFARLLENIKLLELCNIQIGLKLAPYVDKILLEQICQLICKYQSFARISYIVCSNSIPNGMVINADTGKPVLSASTGGISGKLNKLLGISNTWQFNNILSNNGLRKSINIIGCGGIENYNDIHEYIAAGADSVQIGRYLYINGADCLKHIIHNFNLPTSYTKSKL